MHQQIIWCKDRPILTRSFYLWKHEPCFMGWIKGHKPPRVADDYLPSVWDIKSLYGEERPDHPTPKPLDCFAIPMRQHVRPGGLCYEPFCGSGSQIMAGEVTGRRVFAMEISPVYVDVAVLRWQQATDNQAVLEDDGRSFHELAAERVPGLRQGVEERHVAGRGADRVGSLRRGDGDADCGLSDVSSATSLSENLAIGAIFTGASIARSYVLRRTSR